MSNELPRLSDASGALASRFVLLQLRHSFYGREDLGLLAETPVRTAEHPELGACWLGSTACARLLLCSRPARGRRWTNLKNWRVRLVAFRAARCIVGADERADCDSLYLDWVSWCREQGRSQPGSKAIFSRDLHAAIPGLQSDSAVGQRRQPAAQVPRRPADRRGNRDASERPGSASGATRMTPLPSRWSAMRGCGPLTVRHAGRRNSLIVHGSPPCPLESENPRARKSRYDSMCISVGSNTMGWQADMADSGGATRGARHSGAHGAGGRGIRWVGFRG